jgi:hypothetical protein
VWLAAAEEVHPQGREDLRDQQVTGRWPGTSRNHDGGANESRAG